MLSFSTIDKIRQLPIEDVVTDYIALKRSGSSFTAKCPFHDERTPSFFVVPSKDIFKCFSCGAGGDAIKFVMLHENIPFQEACEKIASDHGVPIEKKEVKGKTEFEISHEAAMLQMLHAAEVKYQEGMIQYPAARQYLLSRNFSIDTIAEWQIGYCKDWRHFTPDAINLGFTAAESAGLVKTSKKEDKISHYDYFHHRLVIPIRDRKGQVVGFGGRTIQKDVKPKYINSPESAVYSKSNLLFGLDKARKHFKKFGMAILVEGYFDVIRIHDKGWPVAVATCGTALTEQQAKKLKKAVDTVLVLRDGDDAGIKAMEKDVTILLKEQFEVLVCPLPKGEDPDDVFARGFEHVVDVLWNTCDGVEYYWTKWMEEAQTSGSATAIAAAIERVAELLALIDSETRREMYVKLFSKNFKLKASEIAKPIDRARKKKMQEIRDEQEAAAAAASDENFLPSWADPKRLMEDGFVQLRTTSGGHKPGIYVRDGMSLTRITNFTLEPLYHVYEQSNNRRLVEVFNCVRTSVAEMPDECFINQSSFEKELVKKGNFRTELGFNKIHYKLITGWLLNAMPLAYELKTLGWQPEGFFAFSDAVYHKGQLLEYNEMGNIQIDDKYYLSLGKSKIHRDERLIDNPYENDMYLSYRTGAKVTFKTWTEKFWRSFGEHAPYGIAFALLTIHKDITTRVSKMPILYPYGPKGSGKSAFAESIAYLFFAGKDGENQFIKPFNLNPGQGTPFSFFSRIERFRNCPGLFNEFDENIIEDWKFGTIKAAYDGEGREIGDGDSGKKRKTRIQKVQGSLIIIGQYLSIKDDGSVLSRSISRSFTQSRIESLSEEDRFNYLELQAMEHAGLSSVLMELMELREKLAELFPKKFMECRKQLTEETRAMGHKIEERLLNNYSLFMAANLFLEEQLGSLPYSYQEFYKDARTMVIAHNRLLKDNSAIQRFWKAVETLFDQGAIVEGLDIKVQTTDRVELKADGEVAWKELPKMDSQILLIRFSNVYAKYEKHYRERTGKAAPVEDTLLTYMKDQPYYIGLCPREQFNDKRTSAFVFDYDKLKELGVVLQKTHSHRPEMEVETVPKDDFKKSRPTASDNLFSKDETPF